MWFRLFILSIVVAYAYKAIYMATRKAGLFWKWTAAAIYWGLFIVIVATVIYMSNHWTEMREEYPGMYDFTLGAFFTVFFTCLIICLFHLVDDIIWFVKWIKKQVTQKHGESIGARITRGDFITKSGLVLGGIVFGSFMWGITKGKFAFRVIEQKLGFKNLPDAFDGMRIVQISDAHLGSFGKNTEPIERAVQMVNDLNPDYIFFTGDLINSHQDEAQPYIDIFKKLKAKHGKYSILGNHDYGYYGDFTEEEQEEIKQGVIDTLKKMDLPPLLNEGVQLSQGNDKINLLGVENWGQSHWFPKLGDVDAAMKNLNMDDFTILLSHDPTHWDEHVLGKQNVELTLSGHTHGGQMGLHIPGVLELSAAQLMFKRWAGIYKEQDQQLYINRGLGYLIFPGRVGMAPEITLLELTKSQA